MAFLMHKLLARQVTRVLGVDPASLTAIQQELSGLAASGAVSADAARFIDLLQDYRCRPTDRG